MTITERIKSIRTLLSGKPEVNEPVEGASENDASTKLEGEALENTTKNADAAAGGDMTQKWDELVAKLDDLATRVAALEGSGMSAELASQKTAMSEIVNGMSEISSEIDALKVVPLGEIAGKENKPAVNNAVNDKTLTKTAETLKWRIATGLSKPSRADRSSVN